jgi:hypothetical protein
MTNTTQAATETKDSFGIPLYKTTLPISNDRPIRVELRNFEARGATVRFERWNGDLLASFKSSFPAATWSQHYKTWGVSVMLTRTSPVHVNAVLAVELSDRAKSPMASRRGRSPSSMYRPTPLSFAFKVDGELTA